MQLLNNVRQKGQEFKAANLAVHVGRRDGSGKKGCGEQKDGNEFELAFYSHPTVYCHSTAEFTPISNAG